MPLAGDDAGQRAYKVGTLQLLPQTENVFLIFKDGWHPAEVAPENAIVEWQWTKKAATIAFRNPKRDCTFYLHVDNPGQRVRRAADGRTSLLNGQPVDRFTLAPKQEHIQRTALDRRAAGHGETWRNCAFRSIRPTCRPCCPPANSRDPRELGVRVFHAFVEPR